LRNLVVSNLSSAGTLSTVAVTVGAAPGARNLAIANLASAGSLSTLAVGIVPATNTGNGSTMSFTPSAARTITINATGNVFTANSTFWSLADPKKPRGWKDPDATVDITFDWGPYLADIVDAIRAGGLEFIVDGGLVAVDFTFVGAKCTVFLSGGTFGNGSTVTRAPVTCRITTSSTPPRIEDRTIFLDIEAR
ncbi:phage fiber-tail adaptor protein, partial [Massilia eurypsychrophila]